jgi:hypothetical protein
MTRLIGLALASAALLAALALSVTGGTSSGSPIVCPDGQTATKVDTGWDCVNNGGNPSNAEDPKNPNADKGDF